MPSIIGKIVAILLGILSIYCFYTLHISQEEKYKNIRENVLSTLVIVVCAAILLLGINFGIRLGVKLLYIRLGLYYVQWLAGIFLLIWIAMFILSWSIALDKPKYYTLNVKNIKQLLVEVLLRATIYTVALMLIASWIGNALIR